MIFDGEVLQITVLSLQISAIATGLSLIIGLPFGTFLALGRFPTRSFLLSMVNTGMGLPPVVVGLFVAMMLWRSGPLNPWPLLPSRATLSSHLRESWLLGLGGPIRLTLCLRLKGLDARSTEHLPQLEIDLVVLE